MISDFQIADPDLREADLPRRTDRLDLADGGAVICANHPVPLRASDSC